MCVHVHTRVFMFTHGGPSSTLRVSLNCSPLYPLRQGLLLGPELVNVISLDSLASLLVIPSPPVLELRAASMTTGHLHEFWGSDPHSHFPGNHFIYGVIFLGLHPSSLTE